MSGSRRKRGPLWIGAAVALALVLGCALLVLHLQRELERERARVLELADKTELLKTLLRRAEVRFEPTQLPPERGLSATEVGQPAGHPPGRRHFVLVPTRPDPAWRARLAQRYFSPLVLEGVYSVITESDGRIVEMHWDKP